MPKCEYKIEYLDRKKNKLISYSCPYTPKTIPDKYNKSEKFCVFHNGREDKNADKFYKEFKRIYESGDHTFIGFVFPKGFSFKKLKEETGDIEFIEANFFEAIFLDCADFSETKFSGYANFIVATFAEEADFENTTFLGEADFYVTTFSGDANFLEVTFSGETIFAEANFLGDAYFGAAKFLGETDFGEAIFSGVTDFGGVTFSGKSKVHFQGKTFEDSSTAHFINLKIEKDADLTFDGVNLNRARLLRTDLDRIKFRELSWRKSGWLAKRNMIYDEIFQTSFFQRLLRRTKLFYKKKEDYHYEVQRLYNQLRMNYENTGRYHEAGDFFVGAMEMRRKGTREGIITRFILSFYKLFSLYGERPIRAFGWLIFLIFISGFINLNAGIKEEGPVLLNSNPKDDVEITIKVGGSNSETEIIRYKYSDTGLKTLAKAEFWNDYLSALSVSLSIFTLKRVESSYNLSDPRWGPIILAIQTALAAMFLSLFILAMNRKFRRTKD